MTHLKIPVSEFLPGDNVFSPSANDVMYSVVEILEPEPGSVDFSVLIRYSTGLEITKYWKDSSVEVTVDRD